ncbi:sugar-binding transcriptional regulator [Paenarthrobacter nitroguajacolicus]|uniref:sugar-binding transcriptional regulator n=1 Tax=Paenarthrobacter nitroguajacolicus TaxID=211146 RepID=UPI00248CE4DA|nr:sugar-binding domain-containing protein [Paenarthrobacter nitroguajacolicus]MDI2033742.1 Deoxyribonucleoside regulator [Paenarthrobacter nitroguajacolicus]
MSKELSLEEQLRHVYAAMQHLKFGRPTVDIAEELGVSRFAVGRMVKYAREQGLVDVTPRLPDPIDATLSKTLASCYGLESAIVCIPAAEGDKAARAAIAAVASKLLSELIEEDDIFGLGPGRTILETCARIQTAPNCDLVQLTGVASTDDDNLEVIMELRRVAQGRMYPLHSPVIATDHIAAQVIRSQPGVRQALKRMDLLDKAVFTVGGWPHSSLLASLLDEAGELDPLLEQGVAAEIGTTLLDAQGRELHLLDDRMIGITTQQLASVPVKVALGGGPGKKRAVIAALKSGLVDTLVTDVDTAKAALSAAKT